MDDRSDYLGDGLGLVDDKGRVAIPASLRAVLAANSPRADGKDGGTVFVGAHPQQKCLRAYDPAYSKILKAEVEAAVARRLAIDGVVDYNLKRRGANGEPLPFDGSGRFIMPGSSREYANIGDNAFFYGAFDWIEIWDPKTLIEMPGIDDAMQSACRYHCRMKGVVL